MEWLGTKNNIAAIHKEYQRVDSKWLKMQYQLIVYLVLGVTAVELVMYFVLQRLGMVFTSEQEYLIKYLAIPFLGNFALMLAAGQTLHGKKLDERRKIYIITALLSVMAFWIYTIHMIFSCVGMIFLIPILLTVVYADQKLTALTATLCVLGKAAADRFPVWVPERNLSVLTIEEKVDSALSLGVLVVFYAIAAFMIRAEKEKTDAAVRLEKERQKYQTEALTDQLTRVWNRQALRQMFNFMMQDDKQYFLTMMDLDDFKTLNDTYGHAQGDQYLRELGGILLGLAGNEVAPFRYGGDEFCVLFRGCERERVREICRTIQSRYAESEVNQQRQSVSVSIGVAEFHRGETPAQLLNRADAALYRAKQIDRKGWVCFEDE